MRRITLICLMFFVWEATKGQKLYYRNGNATNNPVVEKPLPPKVYEDELKYNNNNVVADSSKLYNLDVFLSQMVAKGAFPGCRVLAAQGGKVFYDKSFGYQTLDKMTLVNRNTIYDLASVTKIASTTLVVMKLYEQKKLDLDKTLGDYLPIVQNTDKAGLKIRDLLLHQAGLKSWIPFYRTFLDSAGYQKPEVFSSKLSAPFNISVAQWLYMNAAYKDTIWNTILASPLENKGRMVYSDLDFYFLAAVAEKITGQSIDKLAADMFYKPMGLKRIGYSPLSFISRDSIAPTENDKVFRFQLLRGYVHDPGAALFGGIAGHAGLFATAEDLAAVMQMLLWGGHYRGTQYLQKETIALFTQYNSTISRRGLGFDKPAPDATDGGPAGNRCSPTTFGHQGFTGTCVWVDPTNDLVFVFLSNRVCPSADNSLINRLSIRTIVQDRIYDALGIAQDATRATTYKQIMGK